MTRLPLRPCLLTALPAVCLLMLPLTTGCDARAIDAPKTVESGEQQGPAELERLARTDQAALLQRCLEHYQANYRNFTCTFTKQERIAGVLREAQRVQVWFRDEPFSVAMKWLENPGAGDRLLYAEGKYDNKMLVRPAVGWQRALVGNRVAKDLDDPAVKSQSLRPVSMFGFARNLQDLIRVYRLAEKRGDLESSFEGYAEVDGRQCMVLVRRLPQNPDYPAEKTTLYIDAEYLVPTAIRAETAEGQLVSNYLYRDLQFNQSMDEDTFTPEALGM
ncbi:MAG: DUF1571 domain-containing protein [Planctomycetota bacterium]